MTGMTGLKAYIWSSMDGAREERDLTERCKQSLRQCKSNDNDGIVADTDVVNDDVELQDDDVEDDEVESDDVEDDVEAMRMRVIMRKMTWRMIR